MKRLHLLALAFLAAMAVASGEQIVIDMTTDDLEVEAPPAQNESSADSGDQIVINVLEEGQEPSDRSEYREDQIVIDVPAEPPSSGQLGKRAREDQQKEDEARAEVDRLVDEMNRSSQEHEQARRDYDEINHAAAVRVDEASQVAENRRRMEGAGERTEQLRQELIAARQRWWAARQESAASKQELEKALDRDLKEMLGEAEKTAAAPRSETPGRKAADTIFSPQAGDAGKTSEDPGELWGDGGKMMRDAEEMAIGERILEPDGTLPEGGGELEREVREQADALGLQDEPSLPEATANQETISVTDQSIRQSERRRSEESKVAMDSLRKAAEIRQQESAAQLQAESAARAVEQAGGAAQAVKQQASAAAEAAAGAGTVGSSISEAVQQGAAAAAAGVGSSMGAAAAGAAGIGSSGGGQATIALPPTWSGGGGSPAGTAPSSSEKDAGDGYGPSSGPK